MTKTELEEKIKNGESVWVANRWCFPYEVNLTDNHYIDIADNEESLMLAYLDDVELIDYLKYIFETKEKAQHYHDHSNVERVEKLPFLTWEEFLMKKHIWFIGYNVNCYKLFITANNKIKLINTSKSSELIKIWNLTEQNFYLAYDECVKLFKGE